MFYSVKKVAGHPCFDMQELIYSVFYSATKDAPFGKEIFPQRFTTPNRTWVYLKGVRGDFEALYKLLLKKDIVERKRIYSQLSDNNMIELLCEDPSIDPDCFIDWDSKIGKKIKEVIATCYDKLDLSHFKVTGCKLKPTHRYYRDYIKLNKSVCPFCSINTYKNPLNPRREDFDHYLPKSTYPMAAANMNNLVPMCSECNQDFKKSQDLLYEAGHRVVAFYPFSNLAGVSIVVKSTINPKPPYIRTWSVDILPNNVDEAPKIANWMRVFSIESRLVNELEQHHEEWMQQALDEMDGKPFNSESLFVDHMKTRVNLEALKVKRRSAPGSQLKMGLYKYMSSSADPVFIKSYMKQHNEAVQKEI